MTGNTQVVKKDEVALPITPMELLQLAVKQGGTDLDKMKQLMDLQERWEKNEAKKAFVEAMTLFKAHPPVILKTKLVSFGDTSYRHALSGESAEKIGAALAEYGFSHRWETVQGESGKVRVTCILTHAKGHSESTTLEATPDTSGKKNSIQAIGSTVSYLQRYTLFAATGLVPKDIDDDGRNIARHLEPDRKAQLIEEIERSGDKRALESLWATVASECSRAGDTESYDELKALVNKKIKAFTAGVDDPVCTPEQLAELRRQCKDAGVSEDAVCGAGKVDRLEDIRAADYERAAKWVQRKRSASSRPLTLDEETSVLLKIDSAKDAEEAALVLDSLRGNPSYLRAEKAFQNRWTNQGAN